MKAVRLFSAVFGVSLLLSGAALAGGNKNEKKTTLHLTETVTVEGKQLAPGDYKVESDNSGSQTTVNILRGKETVVSVPATVQAASSSPREDGYGTRTEPDGSKQLISIFIHGAEYDLSGSGTGAGQTGSGQQ